MTGFELLLNICGGVALLLWATRMVRTGIERAYGVYLRRLLQHAARNRLAAFSSGLAAATILQSATATALLAISFATSGLLQTGPALAVMLGADVGSTLVVQVLSFDISWLSPALILLGVTLFLSTETRQPRQLGRIIIGLGLMLLSLKLIVGGSEPLRDSATLRLIMTPLANEPLLALLIGAALTWLAHSSVAMVLLIMSLSSVGLIPLTLGFILVLGANIGSGLIPLILTLRQPRTARRIPLGNFLFRLVGALVVLGLVEIIGPHLALAGLEPARQIANFHTAFNLLLALAFLPLTALAARLTERLLPDPTSDNPPDPATLSPPSFLDPDAIATPRLALTFATREVLRLAERVEAVLRFALDMFQADDKHEVAWVGKADDEIDRMHNAIKAYLTQLSRNQLNEEDSRRCMEITTFTIKLEHIGDIIEKNLLELARKKIKHQADFSDEGWNELTTIHTQVLENMQLALNVFLYSDRQSARQLLHAKEKFRELEYRSNQRHIARLRAGEVASIETSAIHLDILRDLKQINSLLASAAYPVLQQYGELLDSRLVKKPGKSQA